MICGVQKYSYYVSIDGGASYTIVDLNKYPKITAALVSKEVFYRFTCDDWVIQRSLNKPIYDAILGFMQNPCSSTLKIQMQIRDGVTILWTGYLKINNISINESLGILTIKPQTIDDYKFWDDYKSTVFIANTLFREVTYSTASTTYTVGVYRNGDVPAMGGMDLCEINPGVPEEYVFAQQRISFLAPGYAQGNGVYSTGYDEPTATNCPTNLYYKAQCEPETLPAETLGTLFIRIDDIIDQFLIEKETGLTLESTFLNNYINPITGERNQLNNIVIGLIADITGVDGKNREFTFTKLMDILKKFNCFWWVEDGKLKIEHIKTIKVARSSLIDLTLSKFDKYKPLYETKYNFSIEVPGVEEFSYAEGDNRIGTIEYINGLSDESKTTKYELTEFNADVIKMINYPDSYSEDNYMILATNDAYEILEELNEDLGVNIINWHLSWEKILNNYWIYNRPFTQGLINGSLVVFSDLEKTKVESDIEFPNLDDCYDPSKEITTNLGDGLVTSFELDTANSFIKVTLKHNACS